MTQQLINVSPANNGASSDSPNAAFTKVNSNFTELYSGAVSATPASLVVGAATGGYQGPGSVNAVSVYVNGVAALTSQPTSLVVGSPTGGNLGAGTVNATGLYVNGVAAATTASTAFPSLVIGSPAGGNEGAGTVNATGLLVNGVSVPAPLPRTPTEISSGVTPTNYGYVPGDPRRYGGTGGVYGAVPSTDDSAAFASAVATGLVVLPAGLAFKIVTQGTSFAGQMSVTGQGQTSQLYCDGPLLTVTSGTGSLFSNFYMDSISTPCVFQRNVVTNVATTAAAIGPVTFTASVAGATAGTLTAAVTNGTYSFRFQDGEIRTVTITGGTAVSWSTALSSVAGSITTAGCLTITVANGAGIAKGQQVFGQNQWNGATVTAVSGTTVTLSDPASYSGTGIAVSFYSITFNTGAAAIATITNSKADGLRPPTVNDTDVYPSLSGSQITQSQYGPILKVTGDHVVIEKIYGRFVQLELLNCNQSQVRDNDFKAGLGNNGQGYGGIVFINTGASRLRGNSALRNRVREAGNEGIFIQGCTEFIVANNAIYGCGDSGIEFYQDGPGTTPIGGGYNGSSGVTSVGNVCVGNYQGGLNYTGNYSGISGFNTAMCSSSGDYAAWSGAGGVGMYGDGWAVNGLVCEYNFGPAFNFIGNRSTLAGITARENQYGNYGSFAALQIQGQGLLINGVKAWQETNRTTAYTMAVLSSGVANAGNFLGQNTTMMNVDLRDSVTSGSGCLQLAGNVERFNVRTNGTYDQSVEAKAEVTVPYSATMALDLSLGTSFAISASNGSAFTLSPPINGTPGQRFKILIYNVSGGVLGAATFGASMHLAAWTQPANGFNRSIEFEANTNASVFYEINRTTADIPN